MFDLSDTSKGWTLVADRTNQPYLPDNRSAYAGTFDYQSGKYYIHAGYPAPSK